MTRRERDAAQCSPVTLAYLGDAVYELLVREALISRGSQPASSLTAGAAAFVSAHAQSGFYEKIKALLTEEEAAVFRRGRNCGAVGNRHTDPAEYSRATGLEAVFGYLWMSGNEERVRELFAEILRNT